MAEEKHFENKIKRWLQSIGVYSLGTPVQNMKVAPIGYYEKRWAGGKFTQAGLPDMHICVKGKSLDVELKATTGKPSALQIHCIKQINESGGCALLIYPKDFETLKTTIERMIENDSTGRNY